MAGSRVRPAEGDGKPQAKPRWQFLNVTDLDESKAAEARKLVRANAMRDYRRREKQNQQQRRVTTAREKVVGSEPPSSVSSLAAAASALHLHQPARLKEDGSFHWPTEWESTLMEVENITGSRLSSTDPALETARLEKEKRLIRADPKVSRLVTTSLDTGNRDPFASLPIVSPDSSELMHHFGFVFRLKVKPMQNGNGPSPLTTVWIPLTMADPVLFQATINFAAVHRDILQSNRNQPKTLMKKARTINMINGRLRSAEDAVTDACVGVICLLAAMERFNGNCDELRFHIAALRRMVDMRGGLENLSIGQGLLSMFVTWEDMLSSITLAAPPAFPHPPCCAMIRIPLLYPNLPKPELTAYSTLNTDILSIFTSISQLTSRMLRPNCSQDMENLSCQLLRSPDAKNPFLSSLPTSFDFSSPAEKTAFSQERDIIERRLHSMTSLKDIPEQARIQMDYLREASRLGCLIYLHTVLSHTTGPPPTTLPALKLQVINLLAVAETLEYIDIKDQTPPGPLIWILFLGGILPLSDSEELWFAERIDRLVSRCDQFTRFKNERDDLRGVCWANNLKSSPCAKLWRRVQSLWQRHERCSLAEIL